MQKAGFSYDAALLYDEEPISYRKMPKYSFDVNDKQNYNYRGMTLKDAYQAAVGSGYALFAL